MKECEITEIEDLDIDRDLDIDIEETWQNSYGKTKKKEKGRKKNVKAL